MISANQAAVNEGFRYSREESSSQAEMAQEGLLEKVGPALGPQEGGRLPKRRPLEVAGREWARSVGGGRGREMNDDWN